MGDSGRTDALSGRDRRVHKRYRVSGPAEFQAGPITATGELLDVGTGGILLRSDVSPSQGTNLQAQFAVADYPGTFKARGRVVRTQLGVVAVMFLDQPDGLQPLLDWLEQKESPGPAAP